MALMLMGVDKFLKDFFAPGGAVEIFMADLLNKVGQLMKMEGVFLYDSKRINSTGTPSGYRRQL